MVGDFPGGFPFAFQVLPITISLNCDDVAGLVPPIRFWMNKLCMVFRGMCVMFV